MNMETKLKNFKVNFINLRINWIIISKNRNKIVGSINQQTWSISIFSSWSQSSTHEIPTLVFSCWTASYVYCSSSKELFAIENNENNKNVCCENLSTNTCWKCLHSETVPILLIALMRHISSQHFRWVDWNNFLFKNLSKIHL